MCNFFWKRCGEEKIDDATTFSDTITTPVDDDDYGDKYNWRHIMEYLSAMTSVRSSGIMDLSCQNYFNLRGE